MSKIDDKLNRVFDIAEQLPGNDITSSTHLPVVDATKEDKDADYELARNNLHLLIEKGNTAIEGILQLAREAENPRSYEVAGQLIKTVSDVTQDLMKLQKNMKDLNKVEDNAPKNVTNALFVGSTAELQKLIKGEKEIKVVDNE